MVVLEMSTKAKGRYVDIVRELCNMYKGGNQKPKECVSESLLPHLYIRMITLAMSQCCESMSVCI